MVLIALPGRKASQGREIHQTPTRLFLTNLEEDSCALVRRISKGRGKAEIIELRSRFEQDLSESGDVVEFDEHTGRLQAAARASHDGFPEDIFEV
jgi:hypothetical protein